MVGSFAVDIFLNMPDHPVVESLVQVLKMVQISCCRILGVQRMISTFDVLVHLLPHSCQALIVVRSLHFRRLGIVSVATAIHLRTLRFLQASSHRFGYCSFYAVLAQILHTFFYFFIGRGVLNTFWTLNILKTLILSTLFSYFGFRRDNLLLQRCHLLHPRIRALRHIIVHVVQERLLINM